MKWYPLCIPPTFGSKLRHSRSGARGRYNMHVTKAQVLDLGLCSIHTKFHSLILGTSGVNSGLSFILKMGPCISNIFPCLTQFGQILDLGPCFIQVFNLYIHLHNNDNKNTMYWFIIKCSKLYTLLGTVGWSENGHEVDDFYVCKFVKVIGLIRILIIIHAFFIKTHHELPIVFDLWI